jgi:hypothetical protein
MRYLHIQNNTDEISGQCGTVKLSQKINYPTNTKKKFFGVGRVAQAVRVHEVLHLNPITTKKYSL